MRYVKDFRAALSNLIAFLSLVCVGWEIGNLVVIIVEMVTDMIQERKTNKDN